MAAIRISNLPNHHDLDHRAMSAIRGGGAPWVFGWIRPYIPGMGKSPPPVTFVQVNNYYAQQMINQIQVVDIDNSGTGAVISVGLDQQGANSRLHPSI